MAPDEDSNFFSRWSRRKVQVRSGEPLPADPPADPPVMQPAAPVAAVAPVMTPASAVEEKPAEAPPALTMEDVARLTPESDYSSFVARGVPSDVRNAAVKKLFSDPRYNVMDGLDVYIDDYSKPSPLSVADMTNMVGAQFLKLVDDPKEPKAADPPQIDAPAVEPSPPIASDTDTPKPPQDDHADLQLQPDHAAEPPGSGRGAG